MKSVSKGIMIVAITMASVFTCAGIYNNSLERIAIDQQENFIAK